MNKEVKKMMKQKREEEMEIVRDLHERMTATNRANKSKVIKIAKDITSLCITATLEGKGIWFVDFAGHVNMFEVRMYESQEATETTDPRRYRVYLDSKCFDALKDIKEIEKEIKAVIALY